MTKAQNKSVDVWHETYRHHPDRYERLVSVEDYEGNLLKKIREIVPLDGKTVVEFGAGTGRVSTLVQPLAKSLFAFDLHPKMLQKAGPKLRRHSAQGWGIAVGDNRRMPVAAGVADVTLEGWSFGHLKTWYPDSWADEIEMAMDEMERVTRADGTIILIETQGTGQTQPRSLPQLIPFEQYIEEVRGYSKTWIRTDYRYASQEDAKARIAPMFGEGLLDALVEDEDQGGWIMPECTGLWWKRKG